MREADRQLVARLGLFGLPVNLADATLRCFHDVLELKVGTVLSAGLSDSQLSEFEQLHDNEDEKGMMDWFGRHRPDYPALTHRAYNELCETVARHSHWLRILVTPPEDDDE